MQNRLVCLIWYRDWWSIYQHEPIPALWIIAGYGAISGIREIKGGWFFWQVRFLSVLCGAF